MPDLSPDQAAVLAALTRFAAGRGNPFRATNRELSAGSGLPSAACRRALLALDRAGRIRRAGFARLRTIEVMG